MGSSVPAACVPRHSSHRYIDGISCTQSRLLAFLSRFESNCLQLMLTHVMHMPLDDPVGEGTLQNHFGKHQLGRSQPCLHHSTAVSVHLWVQSWSVQELHLVHVASPTRYPVSAVCVAELWSVIYLECTRLSTGPCLVAVASMICSLAWASWLWPPPSQDLVLSLQLQLCDPCMSHLVHWSVRLFLLNLTFLSWALHDLANYPVVFCFVFGHDNHVIRDDLDPRNVSKGFFSSLLLH